MARFTANDILAGLGIFKMLFGGKKKVAAIIDIIAELAENFQFSDGLKDRIEANVAARKGLQLSPEDTAKLLDVMNDIESLPQRVRDMF